MDHIIWSIGVIFGLEFLVGYSLSFRSFIFGNHAFHMVIPTLSLTVYNEKYNKDCQNLLHFLVVFRELIFYSSWNSFHFFLEISHFFLQITLYII